MSTKIHEGRKLVDPKQSLFEVVKIVDKAISAAFRESARAVVSDQAARFFVNRQAPEKANLGDSLFTIAERMWRAEQGELGFRDTTNDHLRFRIVFGEARPGVVLVRPFFQERAYGDALDRTGLFEDYHYQDQTDRPRGVRATEWKQRRKDWDSVMGERDTIAHLPMWEFPVSLHRVFDGSDRDFDPNAYVDIAEHMRDTLTRAVLERVFGLDPALRRDPFRSLFRVGEIVDDHWAGLDDSITAPRNIPPLTTPWKGLLPAIEFPEAVVNVLAEKCGFSHP